MNTASKRKSPKIFTPTKHHAAIGERQFSVRHYIDSTFNAASQLITFFAIAVARVFLNETIRVEECARSKREVETSILQTRSLLASSHSNFMGQI